MPESLLPLPYETDAQYRGRPLVIELHPAHLHIREKGRQTGYDVSYLGIYQHAALLAAEREIAARKQAGKIRKGRRCH